MPGRAAGLPIEFSAVPEAAAAQAEWTGTQGELATAQEDKIRFEGELRRLTEQEQASRRAAEEYAAEIAALGVERTEVTSGYQPGDRIKITDGPFSNFYGIVEEVDMAKERIRVVASMFNRETPVELGLDQVEPASEEE